MSPIKLGFTEADNSIVYSIYQALIQHGVSPESMDRGYAKANYLGRICPNTAKRSCQLGSHDGILAPQEVMDYALDAAESNEAIRRLVEGTLHHSTPWALDDLDPKTSEDATLRERLARTTQTLRDILERQGIQKGTPDYQERMAIGLYFLALVPSKTEVDTAGKTTFFLLHHELEEFGLFEWAQYLYQNGGWGVTYEKGPEYTALESLNHHKGKCTELSKILYAILRSAGIPAQFVYVNPSGTRHAAARKDWGKSPLEHHVCVGVPTATGLRLLDTTMTSLATSSLPREYYPFSNREFWSMDLSNRANKLKNQGTISAALDVFNTANALDPESPLILYNRSLLFTMTDKFSEAKADFSAAYTIYPLIEFGIVHAMWFTKTRDTEGALKLLDKIVSRFPEWSMPYQLKAQIYTVQENYDDAENEYTHLIGLGGDNAMYYYARGSIRFRNGNYKDATADFTAVLKAKPDFIDALVNRANTYIKTRQGALARADIDALIARGRTSAVMFSERAATWLEEGNWQQAINDCAKGIKAQNDFPDTYRVRALAQIGLRSFSAARQDYLKFVTLSPNDANATDSSIRHYVGTILEKTWSDPQHLSQAELFNETTGIEIAKFQRVIFMAGLAWERGEREKAVTFIKDFINSLVLENFISNDVKSLVRQVLGDLPSPMLQNSQVAELLKPIQ